MEMLQSIGNSVIFDIGCLVSAVRQDQGIRVAHCNAVSGELQHKKIVRAVAECICVFDRNPKAVCQKPDSGCFAVKQQNYCGNAEFLRFLNARIRFYMTAVHVLFLKLLRS